MLEILIIIWLVRRVGTIVRNKGHRAGGYQLMAVVLWFAGEFGGAVFGGVLGMVLTGSEPQLGMIYLPALVGAACGAWGALKIARSVTPVEQDWSAEDLGPPEEPLPRPPAPVDERFEEQGERSQKPDWRFEADKQSPPD